MYTPNTNTISNSELKTGQMNSNLLASKSSEKVLCYQEKNSVLFRQNSRHHLCIHKKKLHIYIYYRREKYENFKQGHPKATPYVFTFYFHNLNFFNDYY